VNDRVWMTGWFCRYDTKRAKAHWLEFGHSYCGIVLASNDAVKDVDGRRDECKRCVSAIRRKNL
jgi:hypothetical protein